MGEAMEEDSTAASTVVAVTTDGRWVGGAA